MRYDYDLLAMSNRLVKMNNKVATFALLSCLSTILAVIAIILAIWAHF